MNKTTRNIFNGTLQWKRYGDGTILPLGKALARQSGARPDQKLRVSINEITVDGTRECVMTVRWTPQYTAAYDVAKNQEGGR
jgi:hypothetical protein